MTTETTRRTIFSPEPGPISSGTMRLQDLLENFMYYIPEDRNDLYDEAVLGIIAIGSGKDVDDETYEEFQGVLEEIVDVLNYISPDHTYFGSNEGDGACYGWWAVDYPEDHDPEDDDCPCEECLCTSSHVVGKEVK